MSSASPSSVIDHNHLVDYTSSLTISDTNSIDNDPGEISILIHSLVEQVESSAIDSTTHDNLRDYLYGLFDKFTYGNESKTMIQTTNLVQAYHTLLAKKSLNSAHSSDSEDRTIVQTSVREYRTETLTVANCSNDQDVWLVVDLDTNSNDTFTRNLDENKVSAIHTHTHLTCMKDLQFKKELKVVLKFFLIEMKKFIQLERNF